MRHRIISRLVGTRRFILSCLLLTLCLSSPAHAVPSFARQTGLACEACHTVYPELTPFGRRFKLNGYVLSTRSTISDMDVNKNTNLTLQDLPPLSVMVQVSSSWTNKAVADSALTNSTSAQNGITEFPQQLSLFYAGKISDNMGAFFQITYDQEGGSFGMDNSDIRFADHTADNELVYGLTLNNNPTVQDVWNSTPGWGFPFYTVPHAVPTPGTSPMLNNTLGGNVAGIGAYVFIDDRFYLEATTYRSAIQGGGSHFNDSTSGSGIINNFAPYWRAAFEQQWKQNSLEIGTFGMHAKYVPDSILATYGVNNADTYLDAGADMQFQHIGDNHIFTWLTTFIHENVDHNMSVASPTAANASTSLDSYQTAVTYYYRRRFGGSLGFTKTTGTPDSVMYTAAETTGYGKGKPDSQFETIELDYLPWLNTKILAQYTLYNQFNGGSGSYDGVSGRKASDNNTASLAMWFTF